LSRVGTPLTPFTDGEPRSAQSYYDAESGAKSQEVEEGEGWDVEDADLELPPDLVIKLGDPVDGRCGLC